MRTNNDKVKNVIISVYFILIVLAILMATVFNAFSDLTNNPAITFAIITFAFALAFYLVHAIAKYFEYDSDGIKIVVINKGLLLSEHFNYREHKIEIDKEDLIGYKFHNYFVYRSLVLYIKGHHGHQKKTAFNVTLVARKKRRYIRQSLRKIVKENS